MGSHMTSEDGIAVIVAFLAVATYLSSYRWTTAIPRLFTPKIVARRREIADLEAETRGLSDVSNFTQHSKNTRQLNKLRQELDAMVKEHRGKGVAINLAPYVFAWVLQLAMLLPLHQLYGQLELVMVPDVVVTAVPFPASEVVSLQLQPFVKVPIVGGFRTLAVVPWF